MSATTQTVIVEPDMAPIEQSQAPQIAEGQRIEVANDEQYEFAAGWLRSNKAMQAEIKKTLEEPIGLANRAHKSLTTLRARFLAPLLEGEKLVKDKMARYVDRRERAAQAERRAQEAQARREAEGRRLAEAEKLEAAGADRAAEKALSRPIVTEVIPEAPKLTSAGTSTRKTYSARVVDLEVLVAAVASGAVPLAMVQANEKALNAMAKGLKEDFAVPGCEVEVKTTISSRGA